MDDSNVPIPSNVSDRGARIINKTGSRTMKSYLVTGGELRGLARADGFGMVSLSVASTFASLAATTDNKWMWLNVILFMVFFTWSLWDRFSLIKTIRDESDN